MIIKLTSKKPVAVTQEGTKYEYCDIYINISHIVSMKQEVSSTLIVLDNKDSLVEVKEKAEDIQREINEYHFSFSEREY